MRRLPILLVFLLTPSWAWAHNVGVDCKLRGDKVEVEAFYDDDTPAAKAKIWVENARQEIIERDLTDAKGKWTFAAPPSGKYVVHVDAGAGHRAKKEFVVSAELTSDGPSRDEFTQSKWWKAAIGVVIIAGLSGAFLVASLLRKNGKPPLAA